MVSESGGGDRIRTRGLLGANEMLFQLSYAPDSIFNSKEQYLEI